MKYPIGFTFIGVDPKFISDEHVINCKVVDYNKGHYSIEWENVFDIPNPYSTHGTWLASEDQIDRYMNGYEIYQSPLFQAMRENED